VNVGTVLIVMDEGMCAWNRLIVALHWRCTVLCVAGQRLFFEGATAADQEKRTFFMKIVSGRYVLLRVETRSVILAVINHRLFVFQSTQNSG
jgi:hypothetical protein